MQHRLRRRRKGAVLSIELIIVLPILLAVVLASVEFGLLLMASQGVGAAANVGAREAAKPSSSRASVEATVAAAVQGWRWNNDYEVVIFVNGVKDSGNGLLTAGHGATVSVTVNVPMDEAAPDLLKTLGVTLAGKELTSTYVTLKE
jgi:Flp pilus assembly protein TadG